MKPRTVIHLLLIVLTLAYVLWLMPSSSLWMPGTTLIHSILIIIGVTVFTIIQLIVGAERWNLIQGWKQKPAIEVKVTETQA